jgi:hypothetical protein
VPRPKTVSPWNLNTSMTPSRSVAAALAALPTQDNTPRVIQQFTSIFLVSRYGELWRVYDCEDQEGSARRMPSTGQRAAARVFVALAREAETRLRPFASGEDHAIDPQVLQRQLDESGLVA